MKQNQQVLLIFLFVFLLIFSQYSTASARLMPPHLDEETMKPNGIPTHAGSSIKTEEDDLFNLMGLEECDEKDEECLKRRVVAEAHLDYIYTQRHKPKGSP